MRRFVPTIIIMLAITPGLSLALESGAPQAVASQPAPSAAEMAAQVKSFIQKLAVAADELTKKGESFTKFFEVMPQEGILTPWGSSILLKVPSDTSYTVTIQKVPAAVCSLLKVRNRSDVKIDRPCSTSSASDLVYTYTYSDNKNSRLN